MVGQIGLGTGFEDHNLGAGDDSGDPLGYAGGGAGHSGRIVPVTKHAFLEIGDTEIVVEGHGVGGTRSRGERQGVGGQLAETVPLTLAVQVGDDGLINIIHFVGQTVYKGLDIALGCGNGRTGQADSTVNIPGLDGPIVLFAGEGFGQLPGFGPGTGGLRAVVPDPEDITQTLRFAVTLGELVIGGLFVVELVTESVPINVF